MSHSDPWLHRLPATAAERVKLAILAIHEAHELTKSAPHPDAARVQAAETFLKCLFSGQEPRPAAEAIALRLVPGGDPAHPVALMLQEYCESLELAADGGETYGIGDVVIVWTPSGCTLGIVEGCKGGEALFVQLAGERTGVPIETGRVEVVTRAYLDNADRDRWRGAHAGLVATDRLKSAGSVLRILQKTGGREPRRPAKRGKAA